MMTPIRSLIERYWEHVDKRGTDDCWPWTGDKTSAGYGRIYRRLHNGAYKMMGAHVLSLMIASEEDPAGRFAIHSCDNPGCINWRHLSWGTQKDNMQDARRKGRTRNKPFARGAAHPFRINSSLAKRGIDHPHAVLTEAKVRYIYRLRLRGLTAHEIAKRIGVSWQLIGGIISGAAWSHMLKRDGAPTLAKLKSAGPGQARKLDRSDIPEIRRRLAAGESMRKIGDDYGVNATNIFHIKHGLIWRDA